MNQDRWLYIVTAVTAISNILDNLSIQNSDQVNCNVLKWIHELKCFKNNFFKCAQQRHEKLSITQFNFSMQKNSALSAFSADVMQPELSSD